jgi:lipoprotein-anchoring transpeptidase ErfK/SrfK
VKMYDSDSDAGNLLRLHSHRRTSGVFRLLCVFVALIAAGAKTQECFASEMRVLVSVADQKLLVFQEGLEKERFTISTSRFGTGDRWGSYATPLGALQVADKIGDHAKEGAVFKERHLTGEVLRPNAPGRDPIVTRILWLRGLEPQNANAFPRFIYIHGTPQESLLGSPVSWGCIRMRSSDVVKLFEMVDVGTRVEILNKPVKILLKEQALAARMAQSAQSRQD